MAYVNMGLDEVASWSGVPGRRLDDVQIALALRDLGCTLVQREHVRSSRIYIEGPRAGTWDPPKWIERWCAPAALALLGDLAPWAYGHFGLGVLDAMRRLALDTKYIETIRSAWQDARYESVFMAPRPVLET